MANPQPGVFIEGSNQFAFLEFQWKEGVTASQIKLALAAVGEAKLTNEVLSFGYKAWKLLLKAETPEGFQNFKTLNGKRGFQMPTTQNDFFVWIHSQDASNNFDRARHIVNKLQDVAICVVNQVAFTYHDSRDFTGFEDWTANPKEDERFLAAVIPKGRAGEGGSIVFSQKWIHNLNKFEKVALKEQEGIIGRTKKDSIELEGDEMPNNSHVSRTDVKLDGEAMKIYRRSSPFSTGNDHGLFFLAYACHTKRIQIQLERMLGMTADGIYDRIMEFSEPVTGSYWFAPSQEDLKLILG